jgi:NAD(P)-dependent dehydrogenase (short-subunit alcohol dehydrogenase family)
MPENTKIAWITGTSSGIGAATALRLVKEGWIVAATARSEDKIETLVHHIEAFGVGAGRIVNFPGDVTDALQMADIVEKIEHDLGPIDLAILNAGILHTDTYESFSAALLKQQYEVNVFGTAHCLEPLLRVFRARNRGHIAIVASMAGYRGLPRMVSYGSSKAALIHIAESLAAETRGTGIRVQVVNPGFVNTPMIKGQPFTTPMMMDVDSAAEDLVRGLHGGFFEITFPWVFGLGARILGLLPDQAYIWAIRKIKDMEYRKIKNDPGHEDPKDQSGDGVSKTS